MIFKSPYPSVTIPSVPVTDHVLADVPKRAEKAALIDAATGARMTFGELATNIRRVAGGLAARGFGKGDVVAIYSPNTITYPVAFHGAAYAGGVVTTVNPTYTAEELASQLKDSKARFLVTLGPFLEKATQAAEAAGGIDEIFTFDGAPGSTPFAELMAAEELDPKQRPKIDPTKDLVALPYSSGTTGISKGVMLTHGNLTWNVFNALSCIDFRGDDVLLGVAPMYRLGGFTAALLPVLYKGGAVVMMDRFEADRALAAIEQHGVTVMYGGPPYYEAMLDSQHFEGTDLSTLRFLLCAGAPVPVALIESYLQRGVEFLQHYGLSEAATRVLMLDRASMLGKVGSAGRPQFFTKVRVVHPDMSDVAVGEAGEVVARGPNVTTGYWRQPDLTARAITHGGWLHTGDAARMDEDGYFYVLGRLADEMILAGERVFPNEIEDALKKHADVLDCAAVDMPDATGVAVFVVARPGADLRADEVMAFAQGRLPPAWQPGVVHVIDRIPRNASDKVLRWQLREVLQGQGSKPKGRVG